MSHESQQSLPPLERSDRYRRRRGVIWAASLVVAAALIALGVIGVSRYGRPVWQKHATLLAQVPGLQNSLTAAGNRIDAVEGKVRGWADDQDLLWKRIGRLESRMSSNLRVARKQAQELSAQAQRRMQEQLDQRTTALQTRLTQLETSQETERAQVVRLQKDVAAVRQQMADQMAGLRQDNGRDFTKLDQQLSRLDQQVSHSRRDLDTLAGSLERQRVDFEMGKRRSRELAPGISLAITRTDARYRRFDGWLWLLPDRRTVWVRGQSVQRPVVFYSKRDSRPHELVITQVTKDGVAGYLMLPGRRGAGEQAQLSRFSTAEEGEPRGGAR